MSFPFRRYPLDPTGTSPNNFISGEIHVLGPKAGPYHLVAPFYGPFFNDTVSLKLYKNNIQLIYGRDYWCINLVQDTTSTFSGEVCELLVIKNMSEFDNITINYQNLGGLFQNYAKGLLDLYNAYSKDNRPIDWVTGVKNKQSVYTPAYHLHFLKDVVGWDSLIIAIERLSNAITLKNIPAFEALVDWVNARLTYMDKVKNDVLTILNLKAPIDSPSFTGIPIVPTAAPLIENTQIASTEYADKADVVIKDFLLTNLEDNYGFVENFPIAILQDIENTLKSVPNIFSTWKRFSHSYSGGIDTVPLSSDLLASAWTYDTNTDKLKCNLDTHAHVGIVSDQNYGNFDFITEFSSDDKNDDSIGMVFGFAVVDGREYTLSVFRNLSSTDSVFVAYNYGRVDNEILVTNKGGLTNNLFINPLNEIGKGWSNRTTTFRINRKGNIINIWPSSIDSIAFLENFKITIDLDSNPILSKFKNNTKIGFSCISQKSCSWRIIASPWSRNDRYITPESFKDGVNISEARVKYEIYENVTDSLSLKANVESPAFTGAPTVPTPDDYKFDNQIVNTEYIFNKLGNVKNYTVAVKDDVKNSLTKFSEIFNDWVRFSFRTAGGVNYTDLTEMTNDTWIYDSVNDKIFCTINSNSHIGFVSNQDFGDYDVTVEVTSSDHDDDRIGVVLAYAKIDGEEYYIYASKYLTTPTLSFDVYYNIGKADGFLIGRNAGGDLNHPYSNTNIVNYPDTGWAGKKALIRSVRVGDIITVTTTAINSTELLASTKIVIDLNSKPAYTKFKNNSKFGFACTSQKFSTWSFLGKPWSRNDRYLTPDLLRDGINISEARVKYEIYENVTDSLSLKANVESPVFTGAPTTPTATAGTNTKQLATTAFVQDAIGGYIAITIATGATSVTLSDVEASNPVIGFNGVLTADVTIIIPGTIKRIWGIHNATTGAFTLTVKMASGSGVLVTQGKRNLIYSNTAGIYDAFTDFESIDLSGIPTAPTATAGTNTKQLATTAFVKTAIDAPISKPVLYDNLKTNLTKTNKTANGAFVIRTTGEGIANSAGFTLSAEGIVHPPEYINPGESLDNAYLKVGLSSEGIFRIGGGDFSSNLFTIDCQNGNVVADGDFSAFSDPKLKDFTGVIKDAVSKIEKLNGYHFNWKDIPFNSFKIGKSDIGVSADEVEKIFPEIVKISKNTDEHFKTVAYEKLIPVLIEGIKELSKRIQILEAKNSESSEP